MHPDSASARVPVGLEVGDDPDRWGPPGGGRNRGEGRQTGPSAGRAERAERAGREGETGPWGKRKRRREEDLGWAEKGLGEKKGFAFSRKEQTHSN